MKFALVINCAGAWAGEVAKMAGIGTGEGVMSIPLPVEPRYGIMEGNEIVFNQIKN